MESSLNYITFLNLQSLHFIEGQLNFNMVKGSERLQKFRSALYKEHAYWILMSTRKLCSSLPSAVPDAYNLKLKKSLWIIEGIISPSI